MGILGSYAASLMLPVVGPITTLWTGLVLAVIGGALALIFMRGGDLAGSKVKVRAISLSLVRGLSIIWRQPKVGLCGIIGTINMVGPAALGAFYVTYLATQIHLDQVKGVLIFTIASLFAVPGNVIWGNLANAIGWVNVIRYFSSLLPASAMLYLYYVPQLVGPNFWVIAVGGLIMGMGLSSFIPLNALFIAHAGSEPAAGLAASGLARGMAAVIGPGLVAAVLGFGGYTGVVWTVVAMYLSIMVIAQFIQLPGKVKFVADPGDPAGQAGQALPLADNGSQIAAAASPAANQEKGQVK
jgi:Na+/melibiose symporter-like transporter